MLLLFIHFWIGSNQRVCLVNDENIEDLELPVFRDSGDIVDVSLYKFKWHIITKKLLIKIYFYFRLMKRVKYFTKEERIVL